MRVARGLDAVRRALLAQHGEVTGPAIDDPFQLILWEQVAYLVDDARRHEAFSRLAQRVGLTPAEILDARLDVLTQICASGGKTAAAKRAGRMQESAQRVMDDWDGNLSRALRLPVGRATRALTKFPMIGRPGAEEILLLTRSHPVLALDSNGLRVLLRLGYGAEGKGYSKTYENVRAATASEERSDIAWLTSLHRLLRRHGQRVCRRTGPDCAQCPLTHRCRYYAAEAATG